MLIKHKLEYTALLGDKIEISLQYFEIEQRIIGYCFLFKEHFPVSSFSFVTLMIGVRGGGGRGGGEGGGMLQSFFLFGHVIRPEDFRVRRLVSLP